MSPKTTYLIGAGASYNKHPIASRTLGTPTYSEALDKFVRNSKEDFFRTLGKNSKTKNIYDRCLTITRNCIQFGTPDTYAKWLYENSKIEDYKFLKRLISTYFSILDFDPYSLQGDIPTTEYRVLPFLTSLLVRGKLPENVKIISWNYDSQFEIAASKKNIVLASTEAEKAVSLKGFSAWPNENKNAPDVIKDIDLTPFLIHLNGIAGYKYSQRTFAEECNANYLELIATDHEPLLSFSWEDTSDEILPIFVHKRLALARKMAIGTEYLVIIGYSFPFFNRIFDKILLQDMSQTLKCMSSKQSVLIVR